MRGIFRTLGVVSLFAMAPLTASADQIAILPTNGSILVNVTTPSLIYQVGVLDAAPTEFTPVEGFSAATFSGAFAPVAGGDGFVSVLPGPSFGELTTTNDPAIPDLVTSGWADTGVAFTDFASNSGSLYLELITDIPSDQNFSAVEAFVAVAGDANLDRQVNSADIAAIIQAGTFNTGVPATWSTGDFTGDGLVTSADIAAIIQAGQFNAGPYAALNTDNDDMTLPLDDFPYLEIDLDGSAVLTTNMVGNQGFQIISPAGTLTGTATIPPGIFVTNTVQEASTLFFQIPDVLDLGMLVADLDGFIADLAAGNVTFRVANATATGFVEGNVFVVPEPASLALLGLGGLALLRRRSA